LPARACDEPFFVFAFAFPCLPVLPLAPAGVVAVAGAAVDVVPGAVVVGVVEVGVVPLSADEQDSDTEATGSFTGSGIDDSGVPGGTLTVKVSVWPPATVTETTHVSACAAGDGIAASPPVVAAMAISRIQSLWRMNT
jgi:hypothetical protein